jgi:hypothetical protein
MKGGCRFNERLILTVPIMRTLNTAKFAARQSDMTALFDLLGTERVVA